MSPDWPADPALPHLAQALQGPAMAPVFAAAARAAGDMQVLACEVDRVKYRPRRSLSVGYVLQVRDRTGARLRVQRVGARFWRCAVAVTLPSSSASVAAMVRHSLFAQRDASAPRRAGVLSQPGQGGCPGRTGRTARRPRRCRTGALRPGSSAVPASAGRAGPAAPAGRCATHAGKGRRGSWSNRSSKRSRSSCPRPAHNRRSAARFAPADLAVQVQFQNALHRRVQPFGAGVKTQQQPVR